MIIRVGQRLMTPSGFGTVAAIVSMGYRVCVDRKAGTPGYRGSHFTHAELVALNPDGSGERK